MIEVFARRQPATECGILTGVGKQETVAVRVLISGRVQGVAFRASTQAEAEGLGVAGWVHNCQDGRVEAVFEGTPNQVAAAVSWCHRGPSWARVDRVETQPAAPEGFEGFAIR